MAPQVVAPYDYPAMPPPPPPPLAAPPSTGAAVSATVGGCSYVAAPPPPLAAPPAPSYVDSVSMGAPPHPPGPGAVAVAAGAGPLVGRSEEEYMEAFLAELNGFLPIVDEEWLRGEVKRFAAGAALPVSAVAAMNGSQCAQTAAARVRDVQLANAHNATLWAALAVGAMLVGGSPEEVCKYSRLAWVSIRECFDLNEPATVSELLINKAAWDKLPKELQAIVENASAACNVISEGWCQKTNAEAMEDLVKNHKVMARPLPDDVIKALRTQTAKVLDEAIAKDPVTKKVHDSYMAYKAKFDAWSKYSETPYHNKIQA